MPCVTNHPPPQWRHQVGPFVGQALRGVPGPAAPHRPSQLRGPQPSQPRDDGHCQRRQKGQGTDGHVVCYLSILIIAVMFIYIYLFVYPNSSRDVYFYIYWVSAYMG